MDKRIFSLIPVIAIIFGFFYCSFDMITQDTYFIGTTIAVSSMAIILALAKNDKDKK